MTHQTIDTATRVDVIGIIQAEIDRACGDAYPVGRALIAARDAVAELIAQNAAFREVLKNYQDARCFSNTHTRQVARAIERESLAKATGAKP